MYSCPFRHIRAPCSFQLLASPKHYTSAPPAAALEGKSPPRKQASPNARVVVAAQDMELGGRVLLYLFTSQRERDTMLEQAQLLDSQV